MFGWFDNLNFDQITLILIVSDLTIAVTIGLGLKLIARMQASSNDFQILPARAYESQEFGRDFSQHDFDPFSLPTEFVVMESLEGAVIRERFYTVLGSFCEAIYRDGRYRGNQCFVLSSPLYFCMVFLPCVMGFFASISLPTEIF